MKKLMIVLLSLAFVAAFALPSFAGDWNFYGSSRITSFYSDFNDDAGNDDGLTHTLQGNSRIGATVSGDVVGGGFEYGTGVNVRKLYGTWDMGGGQLLVGQTYTPFNQFWSNQVFGSDSDLLNVGGVYNGREPMVMYTCGGFKVALVEPQGSDVVTIDVVTGKLVDQNSDVDIDLPQLEAEYHGDMGAFSYSLSGVYHTYDVEIGGDSYDVDAYGLAAGGKVNFGAFSIAGNLMWGVNAAEYGQWLDTTHGAMYDQTRNDINDEESFGGIIVLGYDMGNIKLEAGYGFVESDYEDDRFVVLGDRYQSDRQTVIYGQAVIDIADGFFIVPEIGQYDYNDPITEGGLDEGKMTYFGLKWQMNF